jgi:hypothetical protein
MNFEDATKSLEIYKKFTNQAKKLTDLFQIAQKNKHSLMIDIPSFKPLPSSLALTLEEYLKSTNFGSVKGVSMPGFEVFNIANPLTNSKANDQVLLVDLFGTVENEIKSYQNSNNDAILKINQGYPIWDQNDEFSRLTADNQQKNNEILKQIQNAESLLNSSIFNGKNPSEKSPFSIPTFQNQPQIDGLSNSNPFDGSNPFQSPNNNFSSPPLYGNQNINTLAFRPAQNMTPVSIIPSHNDLGENMVFSTFPRMQSSSGWNSIINPSFSNGTNPRAQNSNPFYLNQQMSGNNPSQNQNVNIDPFASLAPFNNSSIGTDNGENPPNSSNPFPGTNFKQKSNYVVSSAQGINRNQFQSNGQPFVPNQPNVPFNFTGIQNNNQFTPRSNFTGNSLALNPDYSFVNQTTLQNQQTQNIIAPLNPSYTGYSANSGLNSMNRAEQQNIAFQPGTNLNSNANRNSHNPFL